MSREPVHLAVFARQHLAGGLRITLQGDDREGVRERAGEWGRWADGLPKVEARKESERPTRTLGAQTAEAKKPPATAEIGRPPASPGQRKRRYDPRSPSSEPRSEPPSGDVKEMVPGRESGAWTSVGPWERKVGTAPGKVEQDMNESTGRS